MQAPTLTLVAIGSTIAALVIGLIVFFLHDLATPKPHPQNTRKMDYGTPSADAQHQADVATITALENTITSLRTHLLTQERTVQTACGERNAMQVKNNKLRTQLMDLNRQLLAEIATSAQLRQALERTQSDHASAPIATHMAA